MGEGAAHAEHFESMQRQARTARFGMWVFLASEMLLFGALFALYAGYRAQAPDAFHEGVRHMDLMLGSVNTFVLLTSSFLAAMAVHALRHNRIGQTQLLLLLTVAAGTVFLGIKAMEYVHHIDKGYLPGGVGALSRTWDPGLMLFFTLYYAMTGLHAVHVIVGLGVLLVMTWKVRRQRITRSKSHVLEVGAMYWHLVDVVWLFLWPLFYLTRGGGG